MLLQGNLFTVFKKSMVVLKSVYSILTSFRKKWRVEIHTHTRTNTPPHHQSIAMNFHGPQIVYFKIPFPPYRCLYFQKGTVGG